MSTPRTSSQRLRYLEQILTGSTTVHPVPAAGAREAATRHFETVLLERIRQLTTFLERTDGLEEDVDAVTMRLLLNDYVTAVAHLRAVSRDAGERLDAAADPVNDLRRFLWREEKLRGSLQQTLENAAEP